MFKFSFFFVGFLFIIAFVGSCRSDFDFRPSIGNLEFSRDTIYLDTVFTNIGSSTYTLKVYNRTNKDIQIPSIKLAQGENSNYRLMVDGMPGKTFNNVELLSKDSLFIFIETTIDYDQYANSETTFLYTDKIEFDTGQNYQKVELVTLVQDAVFMYPNRDENGNYEGLPIEGSQDMIYGFILDENDQINGNELLWTDQKPYIIYGYAAVPNGKKLEIQAGAKIHFHDSSGIIVSKNASIEVNGTIENPVIFQGDRLEPFFEDVPGQWGRIWLTSESVNNKIHNAIIKNAVIGLYVQNSPLELQNVQIYNSSNFGIIAQTAIINGFNVVINNAGQSSLVCSIGGNYNFVHSTIANYWNRGHRSLASVILDNTFEISNSFIPLYAHFENCIIFGANNLEITINKAENSTFNFDFTNSLIKFIDYNNSYTDHPLYDFDNDNFYKNCLISKTSNSNKADFVEQTKNDLRILDSSAAKGKANSIYVGTSDILGNTRNTPADMGAYNFVVIEE